MKFLVLISAKSNKFDEYLEQWKNRIKSSLKILFYPHIMAEAIGESTSLAVIETDELNEAITYCNNLMNSASKVRLVQIYDEKTAFEELIKFHNEKIRAEEEYNDAEIKKFTDFGSTETLEILPLIDWQTRNKELKVETGVSYLLITDDKTILFDLGLNMKDEDPSPLLQNMEKLGVSVDDIDIIFITHNHGDHVGGSKWAENKTFSLSSEQINLEGIKVYTPVPMTYPNLSPIYSPEPVILGEGVATTGLIPNSIFIAGYTSEQSLGINVKDKGIVSVVGCGHQTLPKLLQRTTKLFDERFYGLVGGLHYPVDGGPVTFFGYTPHKHRGTGKPPWEAITRDEVSANIESLRKLNPYIVALSSHDSSEPGIRAFKEAFPNKFRRIYVGEKIVI